MCGHADLKHVVLRCIGAGGAESLLGAAVRAVVLELLVAEVNLLSLCERDELHVRVPCAIPPVIDDGGGLCGAATDDEAEEAVEVVEEVSSQCAIAGGTQLCGHSCGFRRPKQVRLRTKPRLSRLRTKPRRLSLQ